jgi:hypothetical protein
VSAPLDLDAIKARADAALGNRIWHPVQAFLEDGYPSYDAEYLAEIEPTTTLALLAEVTRLHAERDGLAIRMTPDLPPTSCTCAACKIRIETGVREEWRNE